MAALRWMAGLCAWVGCAVGLAAAPASHGGIDYEVFVVEAARVELRWLDAAGVPLRRFENVLRAEPTPPAMVMNAGIFELGGVPSGLLIVGGVELRPLNTAEGAGNFFLKPNGVFSIGADGVARIEETSAYQRAKRAGRVAVQSGPLLLAGGRIHAAFLPNSASRLVRNGVGVRSDGKVVFAITAAGALRRPNLHEFAEFFRAQGCDDALFLDGTISQVWTSQTPRSPTGDFGAFLVVSAAP